MNAQTVKALRAARRYDATSRLCLRLAAGVVGVLVILVLVFQ